MKPKLYYRDASWDSPCWALVEMGKRERVVRAGLTAGEAVRLCNEGNIQNARRGRTVRLKVRFIDYPGVDADKFDTEEDAVGEGLA